MSAQASCLLLLRLVQLTKVIFRLGLIVNRHLTTHHGLGLAATAHIVDQSCFHSKSYVCLFVRTLLENQFPLGAPIQILHQVQLYDAHVLLLVIFLQGDHDVSVALLQLRRHFVFDQR